MDRRNIIIIAIAAAVAIGAWIVFAGSGAVMTPSMPTTTTTHPKTL